MDNPSCYLNLPSSLFDVYLRYKQGTRAIVAWLTSYTTDPQLRMSYTIKDLQYLTNIACARRATLPDLVAFHFRETIRNREKLSQHFRKISNAFGEDSDTVNHEFFTEKLREIYTSLCCSNDGRSGKIVRPCHHDDDHNESELDISSGCAYEMLEVDSCDDTAPDVTDQTEQEKRAVQFDKLNSEETSKAPDLADDKLSERLESLKFMKELNEACQGIRQIWQKAARGETPLALASFTTNAVFASLKAYQEQFLFLQDALSPSSVSDDSSVVDESVDLRIEQIFSMVGPECTSRIHSTYSLLQTLRKNQSRSEAVEGSQLIQKPCEYLSKTWSPEPEQESNCITTISQNIKKISCSISHSDVVRSGTPLIRDTSNFMNNKADDLHSLCLKTSIGFQLLIHGYESFTWPEDGRDTTTNFPRLQALRFAGEAKDSIEKVLAHRSMPCRCCFTLASNLEIFQKDLERFLKQKNFDLLMQSPWVSGSHMLEILEMSFYYAMRLCSYKHFFGSLLHIYSCLVELQQMEVLPFLERLCENFGESIFPGGRPKSGFRVSFLRFKGGRLKQSRHDRKQWNLAVPQYSAREAAGFGLPRQPVDSRFRYEKTSLLHSIKNNDYQMNKAAWQEFSSRMKQMPLEGSCMYRAKQGLHTNEASKVEPVCEHKEDRCSNQNHLLDLQEVLARSELVESESNPLPTGAINYFKLYLLVVKAMYAINQEVHDEEPSGGYCMCFMDNLFRRADAWVDGQWKSKEESFGCSELVKTCKSAITKEFSLPREEWHNFLWKHL